MQINKNLMKKVINYIGNFNIIVWIISKALWRKENEGVSYCKKKALISVQRIILVYLRFDYTWKKSQFDSFAGHKYLYCYYFSILDNKMFTLNFKKYKSIHFMQ